MESTIDLSDPGPTEEGGASSTSHPTWTTPAEIEAVENPATFPLDALPGWARDMAEATTEAFQVPPELPGLLALTMAAVACSGRVFVNPKPGWREAMCLYTVTALEPGSMKSPVFDLYRDPIDKFEAELKVKAAPSLFRLAAERTALEKSIARHKDLAGKADDPNVRAHEIALAADEAVELSQLPSAVLPRISTADATPEELTRLLSIHGGRFAVLHDEGGIFDIMAGRYSPSSDLGPWLAGHNGGRLHSDRKGSKSTGDENLVEHTYLTMGFAVQPDVLEKLGRDGRLTGRGVTARFLYALPDSRLGGRDLVDAVPIPQPVDLRYRANMMELLSRLTAEVDGPFPDPINLKLSEGAIRRFQDFQRRVERSLASGGSLQWVKGWGSKLAGQTARIAGLIHMLEHYDGTWGTEISEEAMASAIRIAVCLTDHARAVHDVLGMADDLADARIILAWLKEKKISEFSLRLVYRKVRALDSERTKAAMLRLVDYGWVMPALPPDGERSSGRQSDKYISHPSVYAAGPSPVGEFEGLEA